MPSSVSVKQLYNAPLKIKSAKVKDVLSLAEKYVPLADKWFCEQLSLDNPDESINDATDSGSDVECEVDA